MLFAHTNTHTMGDKNYCAGYYKTNSYIYKIRSKWEWVNVKKTHGGAWVGKEEIYRKWNATSIDILQSNLSSSIFSVL